MADPYETLGVARTASADDLRRAYRTLAKSLHPDLNPGDRAAEERFKQVSAAYDLLRDPDTRRRFDAGEIDGEGHERPPQHFYRDYAAGDEARRYAGSASFADFAEDDDVLAELLRRNAQARADRPGRDVRYGLTIALADAIRGGEQRLTLPTGETIDVTIPAGIVDGRTIRLKGKGEPGRGRGSPGAALIEIAVADDPRFERDGDDLTIEVPVSLREAVLGAKVRVPTPTGSVTMTVPAGSDGTARLRLKGQGMPRGDGGRGDQYVRPRIVLATPPDPALAAFVESWDAGASFDPRGGDGQ